MKLWRDREPLHPMAEEFTVGDDWQLDRRLVEHDCHASQIHAGMLRRLGLLTGREEQKLVAALEEIRARARAGKFIIRRADEDCHTAIEAYLTRKLGDLGRKIHAGRSRNDQVLTALRLFYRAELAELEKGMAALARSVRAAVRRFRDVPLPGFTHTRKAMPATVGIWLAALADGVQDDRKLLGCVRELLDQCPLGTGAGFGVPLPLDRQWAAKKLGFGRVQSNPVYAQLSRGKLESSLLHLLTQVMYDLNRFACDITLFSMPELGYLNLPPSLTTGSSIMPQKRNPDVLEVLRASYHEVLACELQVKTTAANLLTGYNRDIQLTKRPTMVGLEVAKRSVAVMKLVVDSLRVDRKRCRAAMTPELFATQEAYELVMQGIPFRDAYRTVAKRFKP